MLPLPLRSLSRVWHLGTLNPADRGGLYSSSLEGDCLSVSECPAAWQKIARLGGSPIQELTKPEGQFLDIYAVLDAPELRASVLAWALDQGLVVPAQKWRSWNTDEDGEWHYVLCNTQAQVEAERDGMDDDEAPAGHRGVEPMDVVVGTLKLAERLSQTLHEVECCDCMDFAILMWARAQASIDGVYWNEELNPGRLSAPRAGIFPERLAEWSVRTLPHMPVTESDDELEFGA